MPSSPYSRSGISFTCLTTLSNRSPIFATRHPSGSIVLSRLHQLPLDLLQGGRLGLNQPAGAALGADEDLGAGIFGDVEDHLTRTNWLCDQRVTHSPAL